MTAVNTAETSAALIRLDRQLTILRDFVVDLDHHSATTEEVRKTLMQFDMVQMMFDQGFAALKFAAEDASMMP